MSYAMFFPTRPPTVPRAFIHPVDFDGRPSRPHRFQLKPQLNDPALQDLHTAQKLTGATEHNCKLTLLLPAHKITHNSPGGVFSSTKCNKWHMEEMPFSSRHHDSAFVPPPPLQPVRGGERGRKHGVSSMLHFAHGSEQVGRLTRTERCILLK